MDQVELMKLLMYFPGAKKVLPQHMAEFAKEADCPLVASLPQLTFLDVKGRQHGKQA